MISNLEIHPFESNGTTTQHLELYPFETAKMHISAATIIPAIYNITVTGITGSLDAVIELVNTRRILDNYLVIQVLGKDGDAIGSAGYTKTINVSEVKDTEGVMIIGADEKAVKLNWNAVTQLNAKDAVGFFHLPLQSKSSLMGAPILHLQLGVDTVSEKVTGSAVVTQALKDPVVCKSHVTGNLIHETVMPPGESKIRIDLTGYPQIHWPSNGGVGPVILKNFKAILLFNDDWTNGVVQYQYATASGWVKEKQNISIVTYNK